MINVLVTAGWDNYQADRIKVKSFTTEDDAKAYIGEATLYYKGRWATARIIEQDDWMVLEVKPG